MARSNRKAPRSALRSAPPATWHDQPYTPGPIPGTPLHDPWPIPQHCTYIWLAGASGPRGTPVRPMLGFPPSEGHCRGNSVALPMPQGMEAKARAWDLLLKVLSERQGEGIAQAAIGTPGVPHQALLDALAGKLVRYGQGTAAKLAAKAQREAEQTARLQALQESLGIDLQDLDLDL